MSSRNGNSKGFYLTLLVISFMLIIQEIRSQSIDFSSGSIPTRLNLLDQSDNVTSSSEQHRDDTVRVDPLDHFNKYRGGYDITNKHYWSSNIFTGIYGYAIGALWLVGGVIFGGISLVKLFCYKQKSEGFKKRPTCHKQCYLWLILVPIFFTLLAIVASGVVLGANLRFHSQAKSVVDIVIDTANEASETISNTTGAMRVIKDNLGDSGGNVEAERFLSSTSRELDVEAADLRRQATKNRHKIDTALKIVFVLTTLIILVNLIAVIALSVSGVLRLRRVLRLVVILCWFMTALCWLLFGMYFVLDRFGGDTCTALENFQKNPYNNSLSSILPCDELLSAKAVLRDLSAGIHNLVNEVNANILLHQPANLVSVCNPFSDPPAYLYQPDNCPSTSIKIRDIPKVLKVFTCPSTNETTCGNRELFSMSNEDYQTMESYSNSIQNLLNAYPGMESLVECQSVKEAFSEILIEHCGPLKKLTRMVWASMAFLSIIMAILIVLWTTRDRHENRHHFSNESSVGLHSSPANMMELGTVT